MSLREHALDDCYLVWYGPWLAVRDAAVEELCEQGWADRYLNGVNKREAVAARKARWAADLP